MSSEHISAFQKAVRGNPSLQREVRQIEEKARRVAAEALAQLSAREGLPCTADEFLSSNRNQLSEEQLDSVSGGQEWSGGAVIWNWR